MDGKGPERGAYEVAVDIDQFENCAAWLEYCEGFTRFEAETEAARRQGVKRYEAMRHVKDDK